MYWALSLAYTWKKAMVTPIMVCVEFLAVVANQNSNSINHLFWNQSYKPNYHQTLFFASSVLIYHKKYSIYNRRKALYFDTDPESVSVYFCHQEHHGHQTWGISVVPIIKKHVTGLMNFQCEGALVIIFWRAQKFPPLLIYHCLPPPRPRCFLKDGG